MNVQAYTEASEQRLKLRRELMERLAQVREAATALGAAAAGVQPAAVEPRAEEPLAQIDLLCAGARSLTEMLQRNQSETVAAEQALKDARARAHRNRLLALGLLAVSLLGVAVLWCVWPR